MNIIIKLEQRDFERNKEAFDRMSALCGALNPRTDDNVRLSKEKVEKDAGVERDTETVTEDTEPVPPTTRPISPVENTTYTLEQVRKAFADLSKAKGKDMAKGILSDLGAARVPDLPPGKYAEAMARIKAVN